MKTSIEFLEGIKIKSAIVAGVIGASIPLSWLLFLIFFGKESFERWMFIPVAFIPLGGILGGLFFYLMGFVWFPSGKSKLAAIIFSTFIYFITIWLSAFFALSITGHVD